MPDPCPEPCGCYTRTFVTGRSNVISDKNTLVNFCPLHKAAPALLEACQAFAKWFDGWCPTSTCCARSGLPVHEQALKAISLALVEKGATE